MILNAHDKKTIAHPIQKAIKKVLKIESIEHFEDIIIIIKSK